MQSKNTPCDTIVRNLDSLNDLFQEAVVALAERTFSNGADAQDDHQIMCFDLAFVAAELSAAVALFEEAEDKKCDLTSSLANAFATATLPSAALRLKSIMAECALPVDCVDAISNEILSSGRVRILEELGDKVIQSGDAYRANSINEDIDLAREMFWRFGQNVVAPLAEEIHRNDLTIPEEILSPLREMGVFGLSIPERYGGSAPDGGENTAAMIAITEALSSASLGAAGSLITRPEILSRAILEGGADRQKETWLPRLAAGDPLCAISITEPDFGSDVASLNLRATRADGGWVLNGAKTWCTFAGKAGVIMVVARAGDEAGHKGLSIFLVEKPTTEDHEFVVEQSGGGRMTGKAIATIGYRGMHSYDMSYENFFVPNSHLLGEEEGLGRGFYMTMAGMTGGRIQTAARACGVMSAAIDAAITYAGDRKVFGKPLASYQLTKSRIAEMAARYRACRALAYKVAVMIDEGHGRMQASLVKLLACRSAELVTRDTLQLYGAMGYAEETPVSRYFVDARVLSIFEGAEETLAIKVIARELLRRAQN